MMIFMNAEEAREASKANKSKVQALTNKILIDCMGQVHEQATNGFESCRTRRFSAPQEVIEQVCLKLKAHGYNTQILWHEVAGTSDGLVYALQINWED